MNKISFFTVPQIGNFCWCWIDACDLDSHLVFLVGIFLFVLGSPKEYLETFVFPILLPGIASLLHQAKKEKCFEVSGFLSLLLNAQ